MHFAFRVTLKHNPKFVNKFTNVTNSKRFFNKLLYFGTLWPQKNSNTLFIKQQLIQQAVQQECVHGGEYKRCTSVQIN